MSERDAFLKSIRADPDDDTVRLAFADWLDERDDPLGAFIRLQLELDPIRDRIEQPRVRELLENEHEILGKHREEWLGLAAGVGERVSHTSIVFARGLPDRACLSLNTLLSEGKTLFASCPTVREIAVFDLQNRGSELAGYPLLDHIDTLEIADWPTEADTAALFASPRFVSRPVLRFWTGTNTSQCCLNWIPKGVLLSGQVELVQLPPGTAINRAVKRLATQFRRTHKRDLVVRRPFDVTFPLESDYGKLTGRLPDGRPAFLAVQYYEDWAVLVIFDEEGNKVQIRRWKRPAKAEKGWAEARAKLRPGITRMKAFDLAEGIGVSLWDGSHWEFFGSPFERPDYQDEEWWRERGGWIRGWLERGEFVVTFGDSGWANRYTGHIHTT